MRHKTKLTRLILTFALCYFGLYNLFAQPIKKSEIEQIEKKIKRGALTTETLSSIILKENRINLDPNRKIKIYLPPNYERSTKRFPVIYYCHNIFWNPDKMFEDGKVVQLIEKGFAEEVVKEFIFVVADYSTPTTGSIYENSPISGKWIDFTVKELVPFIDSKYRTIASRNSRAVVGDVFGGRGVLKFAMDHADVFSVAYALHPVATGNGNLPWTSLEIDWKKLFQAKTFSDLNGDGRAQIFLTVSQAFLPNLSRPPFYCDFYMDMKNGEPKINIENTRKTKKGFLLDETLEESVENLKKMRGIAFDWGRLDPVSAHVETNRKFSILLEDYGIEHEAEEYNGNPWNKTWIENGRFYSRVLPFLKKHLEFEVIN